MSQFNLQKAIIYFVVAWLIIFVCLPNVMVIITSFLTRDEANIISFKFTLYNYERLMDRTYFKALFHSFYMASVATLFCLIIGYPFATIIAKMSTRIRPIFLFLVILPFWTNSLIRTYALKNVLSVNGILADTLNFLGLHEGRLKLMYTEYAVIIGLVYILLPFMILPLYSSIEKVDSRYIEAARDLGASKLQTFLRITLPLTMPGIISGWLLVWLPALGMFYISDLLGGAKNMMIGNIIQSQFQRIRDWPLGSATSIALTIFMGLLLLFYWRVGKMLGEKSEQVGGNRSE